MASWSKSYWAGLYPNKGECICGEKRNCLSDSSYFWYLSVMFTSQTRRRRDKLDNTSVTCVCMCIRVDSLTAVSTHVRNVCYAKHTFLARSCCFL